MRLENRVCIVTGAAGGIGFGIARRYVAEGAKVAIADVKAEAAAQAAAELSAMGPGEAIGVAMDVTSEEAVNAGIRLVADKWGRVDVLVSNAGVQIVHRIEDFPFADWKKMLAIHLDGAFLTTKACLPLMKAQGGGAIIYMGSVHSKEASPLKAAYITAKHGLLGLARAVAKEGGPHGIRSNVICPGFVRTPLVEKQIADQARVHGIPESEVVEKVMLTESAIKRLLDPGEVADLVAWLCGPSASMVTGTSHVMDGGWSAR